MTFTVSMQLNLITLILETLPVWLELTLFLEVSSTSSGIHFQALFSQSFGWADSRSFSLLSLSILPIFPSHLLFDIPSSVSSHLRKGIQMGRSRIRSYSFPTRSDFNLLRSLRNEVLEGIQRIDFYVDLLFPNALVYSVPASSRTFNLLRFPESSLRNERLTRFNFLDCLLLPPSYVSTVRYRSTFRHFLLSRRFHHLWTSSTSQTRPPTLLGRSHNRFRTTLVLSPRRRELYRVRQ